MPRFGRLPGSRPLVVGIVNITADSFSDGGRYVEADSAIAHAKRLAAHGADLIELGAASSHPDAAPVSTSEERDRLEPVINWARGAGLRIVVDTFNPETQLWAAPLVDGLNDVAGFPDREVCRELATHACSLIAMYSIRSQGRATMEPGDEATVVDSSIRFLEAACRRLSSAGVGTERLVIDPGLGFFLGDGPAPSLAILRALPSIRARLGLPVLISASRKSFLRAVADCELADVGPASLAAELYASRSGADAIRTHDVQALVTALRVDAALCDGTDV